ncbi:MAG: hypothetical protein U0414_07575 [Polyangiaceae bacterium]
MSEPNASPPGSRVLWIVLFVGSAFLAAASLRLTWKYPAFGIALVSILLGVLVWRWVRDRRYARALERGDASRVISKWNAAVDGMPHADTMAPLMAATALAAFGRVREARETLANAKRGPVWDAAVEHRLFVDILLTTFEGEADLAEKHASRLVELPAPSSPEIRTRVLSLREATAALTRAFAHRARPDDLARLEQASMASPLVHWAMRYGATIVAIDHGDLEKSLRLLEGAPDWPAESSFRAFHEELLREATVRGAA